jgi:DNA-binding NtrC family response regulator
MAMALKPDERRFLTWVSQAVKTNPFTELREALDLKIAGCDAVSHPPNGTPAIVRDMAIGKVSDRIEIFERQKRASINHYAGQDRELVATAFLFDVFHRFIPQFDGLIAEQITAGPRSLPVKFAGRVLGLFSQRGFSDADALRYFELSFQLRRAFFFIQKNLVGRSPCMHKLRASLWNNVFTHNIDWYDRFLWNRMEDFSTLILGPTGAGKGTAAMAIGRSGYIPFDLQKGCFAESFTRSFTALNLSQFSPTLIESELFGHKKGAFTGAVEEYKGIFSRCSPYGAIFLDEIGEVGQNVQIKLLQVLQERTFTPVGSHQANRFAGRVIAATNRPLAQMRKEGLLRDDFFYRLCSDVITLPSLAQRICEDPLELDDLLAHTVTRILGKANPELAEMIADEIRRRPGTAYRWPGNVRELEQCVRRILLNRSYTPPPPCESPDPADSLVREMMAGQLDAKSLLTGYCHILYQRLGTYEAVARTISLDRRTVKKYIQEAAILGEAADELAPRH